MKKLLSVLLALAMLLGCVALAEGVDYTGVWVLTGAESMGMQMGPSTLAAVGLDMTMTLNADGTMVVSTMGVEEAGTWAPTDSGIAMTDEEETIHVPYQDGVLMIEDQGTLLMFTREGAAPAVAEAAGYAALAGVPAEAFEGQWLMSSISMMGMDLPADQLGMYMALVLVEGAGIVGTNDTEDGSVVTAAVTYTVEEVANEGTVLSVYAVEDPEGEPMKLYMADENTLFLTEEGAYMLFTRQVEEAAAQ